MQSVSAVIPTYNRSDVIIRAINSVLNQTLSVLEIIIVDDCSSDSTEKMVLSVEDERVRYKKSTQRVGGARARNIGALMSKGNYIAFIDSDDEWKPNHLSQCIETMTSENAAAVFGSYISCHGTRKKDVKLEYHGENMAEYIFSSSGTVRTSTMVFKREPFLAVLFDENMQKHQDWDLSIRFDENSKWACVREPTSILYEEGLDRMSAKMNHSATAMFLSRYSGVVSSAAVARINIKMAYATILTEGRSKSYRRYMEMAGEAIKKAKRRRLIYRVFVILLSIEIFPAKRVYEAVMYILGKVSALKGFRF